VLAPWGDGDVIGSFEDYSALAEEASNRARRDEAARRRRRRLAVALAPLTGLLPASVQERMELEWDAPALAMTLASAIPLFFLGGYCAIVLAAARVGGGSTLPSGVLVAGTYFFLEAALRIGAAASLSRPAGSLIGWIGYGVWSRATGRTLEITGLATASSSGELPSERQERALRDRFLLLEALLALLPAADQDALARRFGFDPLRWGRVTMTALAAVAGLNVFASLAAFAAGVASAADFFWLVAGGALLVEQVIRRRRLARGEAAGSVFGILVGLLARPLLRAAGSASSRVS
jgi:hypothetical protein